jgi:hypothetical protein
VRTGILAGVGRPRFAEADTLAEAELEPDGAGPPALVVVRHLPSVYPKRHKRKRRRRRRPPPVEVVAAALLAAPEPGVPEAPPAPLGPAPADLAAAPVPLPQPVLKPPARRRPRPAEEEPDDSLLRPGPAAIVALFLVAAALFATTVAPAAVFVRPLAGLGLLTGLYATTSAARRGRRLAVPAWTAGLAAVALLVSLLAPGLLGPGYRAATAPPPPAAVQVIPDPLFAGDPTLRQGDWVDASRAGLRQGDVQVRVSAVWIGPPPEPPDPGAGAGDRFLYVRLQVLRFPWGPDPATTEPGPVTLTDPAGRALSLVRALRADASAEDKADDEGATTSDALEITLQFALPPAHPRHLRLEVAGPGWGGPAPLRFFIPGPMIRFGAPRS